MSALYNEIEPHAAEWLRNLVARGLIAEGSIEARSISALDSAELRNYKQAHFFAGIGVWSYALRLAGWPDSVPVWTGSCPCQPFSSAGKGKGFDDSRHLWPVWFERIRQCTPAVVFGEQVASVGGLAWLDAVQTDMENAGYAFAAFDLCAAGFGAPHIRQRLFWVAISEGYERTGDARELLQAQRALRSKARAGYGYELSTAGAVSGTAKTGPWEPATWWFCRDGKLRPAEPGTHPMVDGASRSVGQLRAYGNAIVPQVAAAFIEATIDYIRDRAELT